jgi:hypothetical protein
MCRAWWRGRARQRLAPTRWANPPPVGYWCLTAVRDPRPVGVRRCLTRRPARAGRSPRMSVGGRLRSSPHDGLRPACAAPCCVGGRGGASPLHRGPTHPRSGIRVRRLGAAPVRRGQALPDPSGPQGRYSHSGRPSAVGHDHRRMAGWDAHVPAPAARAGEAPPRPYKVGRPIPGRSLVFDGGALTTLM